MVEHHLWESLAGGVGAEIGVETEGLVDGQVSLDVEERSTGPLGLLEDVTSPAGKHRVDTTHGVLWNLNLDQEDWLEKRWVGKEGGGVQHTTSSWDDLSTTTVDGISVQGHVHNVEANRAHWFLSDWTFLGRPLESRDNGILDFVEVLDGLGLINQDVGTRGVRTETPDLPGIGDIPAVLISKDTGTGLEIVTWSDLAGLDVLGDLLGQRSGSQVETVVLVGRLGQSSHAGVTSNRLTVLDDWVGDAERNTSVVLLKILQANLEVELTGTGNDVLTRLGDEGQNARVGLGQTLETFDKLGQVVGVLDLDGALHDRGDGELHDLHVVGSLAGGEGTRLEQELVNTDETKDVTSWDILNWLSVTTHHENGTLDGLDEQVLLLAWGVVGALNADLKAGADGTGEDTTEGVETTLIGGRHHLGDVKHECTLRITVTDGNGSLVIWGTLVQSLHTVLLGGEWGWEVENHHLQKGIGGWQELPHHDLEELLALEFLLVTSKLDLELLAKLGDLLLLEVHDGVEDPEDRVKDELVEGTLKLLALVIADLGPLLGLWVEVVVTPQTLHHLVLVDTELLGVLGGELTDSEGPAVETGTESDGTLVRVNLDVTEGLVEVGGNDHVDGLNDTGEVLVQVLLGDLELEKSTVDLVDDDDWLDALTKSLAKYGLGLHAHTLDGVDDDECTISDTQGSSHLGGKVNVTWGVDQVDQEVVLLGLDWDILQVLRVLQLGVEGDGGGLDCDTALLLVGTGVGETSLTSLGRGDDTGTLDERVGEGGLSVIDVGNDRHVTDVDRVVHETTDLLDGEAVEK